MSEIVLTDEQQEEIEMYIKLYNDAEEELRVADAKKKSLNSVIKDMLSSYGIKKYVSKDGKSSLSLSTKPNISWDDEKLLHYCKSLNIDGLVKMREYVDMDALENAVYHEVIRPENLKPYQIVKPDIKTLRFTQKKILNE